MIDDKNRRFDNETTRSHASLQVDDEDLVAYLDGELALEQVAGVESELEANDDLRDRLDKLKRAWDLLDELRDEKPNLKFTQSTIEMIALSEERAHQARRSRKAILRRLGVLALACLGSLVLGLFATWQFQRGQKRQALTDLPILADWYAFKNIDSFDWLQKIEGLEYLQAVADAQSDTSGQQENEKLGVEIVPASLAERQVWVEALSESERGQLAACRNDFAIQKPEVRAAVREVVGRVYSTEVTAQKYLKVARACQVVLSNAVDSDVIRLADASLEDREKLFARIVNLKMVHVFADNMPERDRAAILTWCAEMENLYDAELPRGFMLPNGQQSPGARVSADFFLRRDPKYPSVITDEDLDQLKESLSPEAQKILSNQGSKEAEDTTWSHWLEIAGRRPFVGPRLTPSTFFQAEYEKLSDEGREAVEYMTPFKALGALRHDLAQAVEAVEDDLGQELAVRTAQCFDKANVRKVLRLDYFPKVANLTSYRSYRLSELGSMMAVKRWMARSVYFPTLAWNYLLSRTFRVRHWWDRVDDHVIIGALPFRRDVVRLKRDGVTGVVNLCDEYSGPVAEYNKFGIEQLHLPTIDFNHPSPEFVERGADFVETHARRNGKVYVHCKAGRARSATIVLWWLVKFRHLTPALAQNRLLAARPHVNPRIHMRPVIQQLYSALKNRKSE